MNIDPRFAYTQARIQARYGERAGRMTWANLDQVEDFGRYLQQASAAGFHRWLEKLGPTSSDHAVEVSLRDGFRNHVRDVAKWAPDKWHDAVVWFALLVDMEQLRRIATGEPLPDWMRDDPFLRRLIDTPGSWPLGILSKNSADGEQLVIAWRQAWFGYLPGVDKEQGRALRALASLLPIASYHEAPIALLERHFRRYAGRPLALFSYLALVLADLLRLKGQILRRLEFVRGGV